MKNEKSYSGFEQGPIRPPSEAGSLLVRVTRNCPWNRCSFCPVYKGKKFSLRNVTHVLRDIDMVGFYTKQINKILKLEVDISLKHIEKFPDDICKENSEAIRAAYNFVMNGMKSVFIQDGNSFVAKPGDIIKVLLHIKSVFPEVKRITSYGRSSTLAKISDHNLRKMADAGLNRIHIGMETGSDKILKMVKKGGDKATQIKAGKKIKRAGIQLSEYYMPGLGGKFLSRDNAIESAEVLNEINPDYIRLRSLSVRPSTLLEKEVSMGKFDKMGEIETLKEIFIFLKRLNKIDSKIRSDHDLNLLTEINGTLPKDKDNMLAYVRKFLELNVEEQVIFCIGRRINIFNKLEDLKDSRKRDLVAKICFEIGANIDNMDKLIEKLKRRSI